MEIPRWLASALTGILLLAGLTPGAHAGGAGTVEATGHMILSASRSASVDVRLPSDARLSLNYSSGENPSAPRFSSGDEFGALLFVSEESHANTYAAMRLPKSKGASRRLISMGVELCHVQSHCVLPSGEYSLYLVTDVPLSVELKLEGLSGSSSVRMTRQAVAEIGEATASYLHSTPQGSVEAAAHGVGFAPTLTGESNFLFSAFWFRGPSEPFGPAPADRPLLQVGNAGACAFSGAPPPESYAPGCPTGQGRGNFSTFRALDNFGYIQYATTANLPPGQYGRGFYAVHTGIRHPGFVGFWLDLDD
jgi:hypothetical protein